MDCGLSSTSCLPGRAPLPQPDPLWPDCELLCVGLAADCGSPASPLLYVCAAISWGHAGVVP
eukprot:7920666-Alexandrium_andersonii.AAC.1